MSQQIITALPTMAESFHTTTTALSLGITAYMLTVACLVPLSGWMADRFGSRTVFCSAITGFVLASVLCATSVDQTSFVIARVLQGAAAGMMSPLGRLMVLRTTEKKDLVSAIAVTVWPALIAPVIGPPLGGFITDVFGWRWIFLIGITVLLLGSMATVGLGWVKVKMLPFDNKSEFQVILNMPEGSSLEQTTAVAREMAAAIRTEPEVTDYQVYAGVASPYNFNGLVRHYFLRAKPEMGDLMSAIEPTVREALAKIYARKYSAKELTDMNAFFATPSGSSFAGNFMSTFTDKEMINASFGMMPKIMEAMPAIMKGWIDRVLVSGTCYGGMRFYERAAGAPLVIDQGMIQKLWSILLDRSSFSRAALERLVADSVEQVERTLDHILTMSADGGVQFSGVVARSGGGQ